MKITIASRCVRCKLPTSFPIHDRCPVCWEEIGTAGRNEVVTSLGLLDQLEPGTPCGIPMSQAELMRVSGIVRDPKADVGSFEKDPNGGNHG